MKHFQLSVFALLLLQGCGGGSSSSPIEASAPQEPEKIASPLKAGIYDYYVTPKGSTDPSEGERVLDRGLVTASGASIRELFGDPTNIGFMTFLSETEFVWKEARTSHLTSSLRNVSSETPGLALADDMFTAPHPEEQDSQLLFVRIESNLDAPLSYESLSGTYVGQSSRLADGRTATFTIDSTGALTGADDGGCVFNGQVTIPNPEHSSFDVNFTAENCQGDGNGIPASDRNGNFHGLGGYHIDPHARPAVSFLTTNNVLTYTFSGER